MDTSLVVGVCAALVAVAALLVSRRESRAHDRLSTPPRLKLNASFNPGRRSGLQLINCGPGPAMVIVTSLTFDGVPIGPFDEPAVDQMRECLTSVRPAAAPLGGQPLLATGHERYLLSVDDYDPDAHDEFVELIRRRLTVEILYKSLYGGDSYVAAHTARG